MKVISRITAYLFHPLLWPTIMIVIFMTFNKYTFQSMPFGLTVLKIFINTFFFPAICILLMWKLDLIPSLTLDDKKDRILPFVGIISLYVWSFMVVKKGGFPTIMGVFMLGVLISLFISFGINVFYKLGLHTGGIGGVLMAMILQCLISPNNLNYMLLTFIVLAGFVATTRIYLGAHNLMQVYVGFLVGIIGQIFGIFFFQ